MRQGPALPELVQSGWRLFLVGIENPTLVPGKIDLTSPQAKPANNRYPAGYHHAGMDEKTPVTAGDMAQRWLEIDAPAAPPLPAVLDALPIDYHLVALYARDDGRRHFRSILALALQTLAVGALLMCPSSSRQRRPW